MEAWILEDFGALDSGMFGDIGIESGAWEPSVRLRAWCIAYYLGVGFCFGFLEITDKLVVGFTTLGDEISQCFHTLTKAIGF